MNKILDRILGCLIGGAAGDALGYTVEFMSENQIFQRFGSKGISQYVLDHGYALFSDDTQMTLFTANGLLLAAATQGLDLQGDSLIRGIPYGYKQWFSTQMLHTHKTENAASDCWLMQIPRLHALRAPGNTCLSAIAAGCCGKPDQPINNSKGCGGVMRVAPIGLLFPWDQDAVLMTDRLGAEAAALTHGHEMGYIPAAMLVHIVHVLARGNVSSVQEAVVQAMDAMKILFPNAVHLSSFLCLIQQALDLANSDISDLHAIHQLGEGWVGDEALAIAVYCAVKYQDNFDRALIASVNHRGDSDSTGAITGNILGALVGLEGIPQKYIDNLELLDVITQIGNDLYDCGEYFSKHRADSVAVHTWREKYEKTAWINGN